MAKRTDSRRNPRRRQPAGSQTASSGTGRGSSDSAVPSFAAHWPAVTRVDVLTLLAIVVLAAGLRLYQVERIAVEHFDEGVYASSIWFGADRGEEYPDRHLYAPPLFPWLVEQASLAGIVLSDGPQAGARLVNIVAGVLTVAAVWWVGRCWFSPAAGLAAALLAATSGFHLLYSRTMLTDPLLGLGLLCAVCVLPAAITSGGWFLISAGGILTGFAWCIKYNGWLPLAISAAGLTAWQLERWLLQRKQSGDATRAASAWKQLRQEWLRWLAVVAVAIAVWSPVWWGLRNQGGYAAVAANHRQYLVGISGWWESLGRQSAAQLFLSGWPDCLGIALSLALLGWLLTRRSPGEAAGQAQELQIVRSSTGLWLGVAGTAGALAVLTGAAGSTAVLALLAAGEFARRLVPPWSALRSTGRSAGLPSVSAEPGALPADGSHNVSRLQLWLLLAWFAGLLLVTPLYRPYPRLTLPWLISTWLIAGAGLASLARWLVTAVPLTGGSQSNLSAGHALPDANQAFHPGRQATSLTPRTVWSGSLVVVLAFSGTLYLMRSDASRPEQLPAWQPRTGFQQISGDILTSLSTDVVRSGSSATGPVRMAVYVIGEPGLFYQLARGGGEAGALIHPLGDMRFAAPDEPALPLPLFAVLGPHALRDPGIREQLGRFAPRLRLVEQYEYLPSDLVELNSHAPNLRETAGREPASVRLYRVLDQAVNTTRTAE